ncbi:Transcriptional regulator [Candidatus Jidaibacter acanthamoeba]|uniref:Transcriptional regulator n=1 Tax=Candidatus Jidaibacter acanthamoebae TaxID=86105 RepID=A0A0C1QK54_9RICK|nr:CarD family transcriptional regulator [Candidatus Jidaibacter acanthamoeba]KIE04518.1 Transcriptional regulator [Candidatus Jidaibacter acanthamoeba]
MFQVASKKIFTVGDSVVYPSHGVGQITGEETQVIAGVEMKLYVITFAKDKMILRVPTSRAIKTGLRHLCNSDEFSAVMKSLKGKAKIVKGMWSKRAQEYENKINSGDAVAIAEVLRDLYRNIDDPDRSYSERQIYDAALDRLAQEYSAAANINKEEASNLIVDALNQAV